MQPCHSYVCAPVVKAQLSCSVVTTIIRTVVMFVCVHLPCQRSCHYKLKKATNILSVQESKLFCISVVKTQTFLILWLSEHEGSRITSSLRVPPTLCVNRVCAQCVCAVTWGCSDWKGLCCCLEFLLYLTWKLFILPHPTSALPHPAPHWASPRVCILPQPWFNTERFSSWG